jgi:fructose-1-phosphate kinase PfkB-like protein
MILTVTPNPTIDRAIFCRHFHLGGIVRAERDLVIPSGKGVDASLVLHELGGETCVLGLQAGLNGRLHADLLDQRGIPHDMVHAHGETRLAIVLVDLAVNQQSTISAPTLTAGDEQLAGLLKSIRRHAGQAWGLICGGSLPPGLPADSYARLLCCARECGLVTLLDTSRDALRQGVPGFPDILKINLRELRDLMEDGVGARSSRPWAGLPCSYGDDVVGARSSRPWAGLPCSYGDDVVGARSSRPWAGLPRPYEENVVADTDRMFDLAQALGGYLGRWASQAIVITLGAYGAVAVTTSGGYVARPPSVPVVNTAGAGDALDAGLLLARSRGQDWPAALGLGTAAAASVVMNEGTAICHRVQVYELLAQLQVESLPTDRRSETLRG